MGLQLQIETIAHCQAKCVFCPYPTMTRAKGTMTDNLFQKIINDAASVPQIIEVSLQGLGEPLIDKKIIDRVSYVHDTIPHVPIAMYTNGGLLTADKVVEFEEAGLGSLYVSLNATNAEKRRQVMAMDDYDKVVAAIREGIRRTKHMRIVIKAIAEKDLMESGEKEQFAAEWGPRAFLHLEGNWAGETYKSRVVYNEPCSRALGQFMVLWDGRVSMCCFDGEGKVIFGDMNKQTIREVYASPDYVEFRRKHWEGERKTIPICAGCTAI